MGIKRTIEIDGQQVAFKASAAIPRIYRLKFHRDIYNELARLAGGVLQQDAVGVRGLHEDVPPEGLRDEGHLQVAVIALVVVDDVILDAIRINALRWGGLLQAGCPPHRGLHR